MAIDPKYGRVTVENEPGNPIGDDEPVFIIRARDQLAVQAVAQYAQLCQDNGSPPEHLAAVLNAEKRIEEWQAANPELIKIPD